MIVRILPSAASCVAVLLLLLSHCSAAQERKDSPVFKGYKPPDQFPQIKQSDPLYEIWQTFLIARKANAGDVVSQHELGIRYFLGRGVEADTVQAAFWTKKAADQNHPPARFNLAILSYYGWGVPWDPFEAFRHLQYCAQKGMHDAEFFLAFFYLENQVVPLEWDRALALLRKGAEAGYKPAQEFLPKVEESRRQQALSAQADTASSSRTAAASAHHVALGQSLTPVLLDFSADTVRSDQAGTLLKHALQDSGPEMRQALGLSNLLDTDIKADSATFAAIQAAADAGSPEALALLGRITEQGLWGAQDRVRGGGLYLRALRMDYPRAGQLLVSLVRQEGFVQELKRRAAGRESVAMYVWGSLSGLGYDGLLAQQGGYITLKQALAFLEDAAAGGDIHAQVELGLWYFAGRTVERNEGKALELWEDAARRGSREAEIRRAVTRVRKGENDRDIADDFALLWRAAGDGSMLAEVALGYCYETGTAVEPSLPKAVQYYRNAAVRGSQEAFWALRRLHDQVRPSDREFELEE